MSAAIAVTVLTLLPGIICGIFTYTAYRRGYDEGYKAGRIMGYQLCQTETKQEADRIRRARAATEEKKDGGL